MSEHLPETLKPFHDRAVQADERLARLEAALASKTDCGKSDNLEQKKKMVEIEAMLEEANTRLAQEQLKVKALTIENDKHKYRVEHLVRALRAAHDKLERTQGT